MRRRDETSVMIGTVRSLEQLVDAFASESESFKFVALITTLRYLVSMQQVDVRFVEINSSTLA